MPRTVLVAIYSPFASWNIPGAEVERLRREFPSHTFLHALSDARALELIPAADIAFMSELRPAQFEKAARLTWVHSPAAGVGSMLFPAMVASPVVMTNSRGISADTIAEHVLAVTLAMFRKLPLAIRSQMSGHWAQDDALRAPAIRRIAGARVLVVGLGAIGAAVAWRMAALGAEVTGIRRDLSRPLPEGVRDADMPDRLRAVLPGADVVVVAAPLTPETRRMIGAPELSAMHSDALLVNVSRGKLIDEGALIAALLAGTIGGAALDVFEHEPLSADSPLWTLANVLITPHMSGFRPDHWEAIADLFADNLRRYEQGQTLRNPVDKGAGY
jgi:phosphoglycerate dehydrogenase-like enzyme